MGAKSTDPQPPPAVLSGPVAEPCGRSPWPALPSPWTVALVDLAEAGGGPLLPAGVIGVAVEVNPPFPKHSWCPGGVLCEMGVVEVGPAPQSRASHQGWQSC